MNRQVYTLSLDMYNTLKRFSVIFLPVYASATRATHQICGCFTSQRKAITFQQKENELFEI